MSIIVDTDKQWCIYALRERGSRAYRYVGLSTKGAEARLRNHWAEARAGRPGHKNNWLRSQLSESCVVVDVLEVCMPGDKVTLEFREQFWIAAFREAGYALTNLTDGGNSTIGWVPTPETRALWSSQRKGSITGERNPNYAKFGSEHSGYGRVYSPETIARLSEVKMGSNNPNYGKVYTDEEKAQRSRALKGKPMPSSTRSAHTRYHVKKNVTSPLTCKICKEEQ